MRKILTIFLFPFCFSSFAQDKSVQLTGILISTDSLLTIPFANVLIKTQDKGTISDFYGYFSLVANKGDTIVFSCLGYKRTTYVIPKMINDIKNTNKLTIFDNKNVTRTFTYIDDAINIIIRLINKKESHNEILGSEEIFLG